MSAIEITGHTVVIRELIISRSDVADFLASVPEDEREGLAREAFEVGVFCLERARGGKDMDFVRRQVESLLTTVENAVRLIPQATEEKLLAKLGTGDGQVLAPVQVLVQQVERGTQQQLRELRELLANEIDPSKESSSLAKALKKMTDLLDVDRTDSIQGRMDAAVRTVSSWSWRSSMSRGVAPAARRPRLFRPRAAAARTGAAGSSSAARSGSGPPPICPSASAA